MAIFRKKRKSEPEPKQLDYRTVHRLAMILEKAKLGDYVQMMSKPWRSIYLNFLAGIARGAGMVVGASLVGGLVVIFMVQGLKYVARHSDMVPWIGDQVKEGVGFVLKAADEKLGKMEDGEEEDQSSQERGRP
jgi:hypothetical protein